MSDSEYAAPPCSPTVKPVGVSGKEYRRLWNRLNRERCRQAGHRFRERHPELQRPIPREVVMKYRAEKRHLDKPRYYGGWEKAKRRCEPWDCIDDELVMTCDVNDRALGKMIGRSINAIQKRRYRLLKANGKDETQNG